MKDFEHLEPVTRQSTASVIADQIRQGIARGTFPAGMQLGEAKLAASLGVSRGPVREALQRLLQEGLLRSEPHRGVFVATLTAEDVTDLFLARSGLERAAALAILDRDEVDLTPLEDLIARMEEAASNGDWSAVADLDLSFHTALVAAAGSERLDRMFGTLIVQTRMCLSDLESAYTAHTDLVDEHRSLLQAFRDGGRERVLAMIDEHLSEAVADLLRDRGYEHDEKTRPPWGA